MTDKLTKLFNLPLDDDSEEETEPTVPVEESREIVTVDAMNNLDKINSALPSVKGLEASDKEMDDIAALALGSYKDLIDLGMNVEARVAVDILSSASQFLGHAITAKQAKINKKLKMIELQLKKAKLDQSSKDPNEIEGDGKMLDRNELLAEVIRQAKEDASKKD